ncbi:MAG: SufE family protein [Verrucomicrobiales bacterium]|nr:SufE family protein [Verrucomicrobiales bacterium]
MSVIERQEQLIEDYGIIPDPLERFQLIVESGGGSAEPFPEEARTEANLVPGCVSKVWVTGGVKEGILDLSIDSEAPALAAIGTLMCRLYSGARFSEVLAVEPDFIAELGIDRNLTPTRLRGLGNIRKRIVELAGEEV